MADKKDAKKQTKNQTKRTTKGKSDHQTPTRREYEGIRKFMLHRGYEIIDEDWSDGNNHFDFVCFNKDDNVLVFADTAVKNDGSLDFKHKTREEFEKAILQYLPAEEHCDCAVRYDTVTLLVLREDQALIRHTINALSL